MSAVPQYLPLLEEITRTDSFHRLAPLENRESWKRMTPRERRLLGFLFVRRGGWLLCEGRAGVLESFRLAEELLPGEAEIYHGQGSWWLKYGVEHEEVQPLLLAGEKFSKTVELEEDHFEAWYGWGCSLLHLGTQLGESDYLSEADAKFCKAEELLPFDATTRVRFYHDWGLVWSLSGAISGEAFDFRLAINKFEEATRIDVAPPALWSNFGMACWQLGELVGEAELLDQAAAFLRRSIEEGQNEEAALLVFASLLNELYAQRGEDEHLEEAFDLYCRLAEGGVHCAPLWSGWAELMITAFQIQRCEEDLEDAHDFLIQASEIVLDSEVEHVVSTGRLWAVLAGEAVQLKWLEEARDFIERALVRYQEQPDLWAAYGMTLCELGRFTEDDRWYRQAIRKVECGMRLTKEHGLLWHAYGRAVLTLASEVSESRLLLRAVTALRNALTYGEVTPGVYSDLAHALLRLAQGEEELKEEEGSLAEAVDCFETELQLYAQRAEEPPLETLFHYACALDLLGTDSEDGEYYRHAVELLAHVYSLFPEDPAIAFHLAQALWHWGRASGDLASYHRACALLEEMIKAEPDDAAAWELWGSVLMSLSHMVQDLSQDEKSLRLISEAEEKLLQAITLGCDAALYELARLYAGSGQRERAFEQLEVARQRGILPSRSHLLHDPWFSTLHGEVEFGSLLERLPAEEP